MRHAPVTPRVLVTCDWFLKYALAQAAGLNRVGVPSAVLCRAHAREYDGNVEEYWSALDSARHEGVEIFVARDYRGTGLLGGTAGLRSAIRTWGPNVVHVHQYSDFRYGLALDRHAPTLLTIHDPVPHPGQLPPNLLARSNANYWSRRAGALHLHSRRLVGELERRDDKPVYVVPHGMSVREEPLPVPQQVTVLFFGRLEPYKGLDVLAQAMPLVWKQQPDVQVQIAGAGQTPCALAGDPRVTVRRGYIPESELEPLFRSASVVVLPYTQASQSGVASLALGLGVPVVASAIGGLPDVVGSKWLCEPGHAGSLADRLVDAIGHDHRCRRQLLERAWRSFSWEAVAADFRAIYEELIATSR